MRKLRIDREHKLYSAQNMIMYFKRGREVLMDGWSENAK